MLWVQDVRRAILCLSVSFIEIVADGIVVMKKVVQGDTCFVVDHSVLVKMFDRIFSCGSLAITPDSAFRSMPQPLSKMIHMQ